jgi:transcriptional regulator with PAS, ATPase and Fis domain
MNLLQSRNRVMKRVLTLCAGVARVPTTVLLYGESGTGKEVVARHIHDLSNRAENSFVAVNCAAIPETLIESEFFGHEKGAFSGATEQKKGRFELADKGTLLLDEISELPLNLQAKLLRVIQERRLTRVGGTEIVECDVRIIATSNRNLAEMVRVGEFREDLYYRINVFPISIPALRDRTEDIESLCQILIRRLCQRFERPEMRLSNAALAFLMQCQFTGNVRELHNMLERSIILTDGQSIDVGVLAPDMAANTQMETTELDASSFEGMTLADVEREVILSTLAKLNGNRTQTSDQLGISIRTLRNRLREYRSAGFSVVERRFGFAA